MRPVRIACPWMAKGVRCGIKSGETRKANSLKSKQIEANEANALKSKQIEANEAVSVSVNVSDTVYNIYNNGLSRFLNYEFDERKVTDVRTIDVGIGCDNNLVVAQF